MKISTLLVAMAIVTLTSCSNSDDKSSASPIQPIKATTLKGTASFSIGNIVSATRLLGADATFRTILNKEFNSITAENDMKMGAIFTGPGTYDFTKGDAIVTYAKANGFRVHGHALVWHASIPNWLKNYTGTDVEFEALVKTYIKNTVTHFALEKNSAGKSIVESWDVVNEAFTTDAENAVFYKRIPNYLAKCFIWAREADSNVKLFYNDYNLESQSNKVSNVIAMVSSFKTNSTPIDGIGMQMHIDYLYPSWETMNTNLSTIKNTGLLIHFSELDMTINNNKALTTLTTSRAMEQKTRYKEIAYLYQKIPAAQQFGITFWGMRDSDSWLLSFNNNPNEWPLLFDSNYGYKPAFTGFLEGLQTK
jgi:endo-1,4-beta-xylanase